MGEGYRFGKVVAKDAYFPALQSYSGTALEFLVFLLLFCFQSG